MSKKILCIALLIPVLAWSQRVPNEAENIDYLVTYGQSAPPSLGDEDHVQIVFFVAPEAYDKPLYIRIYDPDTGGKHDDVRNRADTYVRYSMYGGAGAFSNRDAQQVNPVGQFKSGSLLVSKTFGNDPSYDGQWVTLGTLNPLQGERSSLLEGYAFKLVIEGLKGDDGNAYRCFLSQHPNFNQAVGGANAFAYKYTFKLPKARGVSHIYPFIEPSVTAIVQNNFDYDKEGNILIYSIKKNRHIARASENAEWAKSRHTMEKEEKNSTIDIQIQKNVEGDNTMSFYITNQYNEAIPFFAVPIGGPPKYKYNPTVLLRSEKTN